MAEYDSLTKKVTHLYTLREMVLPEDEIKVFNESLEIRPEATNEQLKKWINRWRPVIKKLKNWHKQEAYQFGGIIRLTSQQRQK